VYTVASVVELVPFYGHDEWGDVIMTALVGHVINQSLFTGDVQETKIDCDDRPGQVCP